MSDSNTTVINNRILEILEWIQNNDPLPEMNSESDFSKFAVDICNRVLYLLKISASLCHSDYRGYSIDEAPIIGLFVRIFKLYDALTYHYCENHGEIVVLFKRPIFESYVTMNYLIKNGLESCRSYRMSSFASAIKHYRHINRKKENDIQLSPIEERIMWKISNRLKENNFTFEKLDKNRNWRIDGKSFKDLLRSLNNLDSEIAYNFVYSSGSSYIHGDWYDVKIMHLYEENGEYFPKLEHDRVHVMYVNPSTSLCLTAIIDFLEWSKTDTDGQVTDIAHHLIDILNNFDKKHEEFTITKYKEIINNR
ncbi:MAG: hypothetical protein HQ568_07295 [Calditrichaeota bacterium]|nr:hypothetical protein [Calditrichota bacterium]